MAGWNVRVGVPNVDNLKRARIADEEAREEDKQSKKRGLLSPLQLPEAPLSGVSKVVSQIVGQAPVDLPSSPRTPSFNPTVPLPYEGLAPAMPDSHTQAANATAKARGTLDSQRERIPEIKPWLRGLSAAVPGVGRIVDAVKRGGYQTRMQDRAGDQAEAAESAELAATNAELEGDWVGEAGGLQGSAEYRDILGDQNTQASRSHELRLANSGAIPVTDPSVAPKEGYNRHTIGDQTYDFPSSELQSELYSGRSMIMVTPAMAQRDTTLTPLVGQRVSRQWLGNQASNYRTEETNQTRRDVAAKQIESRNRNFDKLLGLRRSVADGSYGGSPADLYRGISDQQDYLIGLYRQQDAIREALNLTYQGAPNYDALIADRRAIELELARVKPLVNELTTLAGSSLKTQAPNVQGIKAPSTPTPSSPNPSTPNPTAPSPVAPSTLPSSSRPPIDYDPFR